MIPYPGDSSRPPYPLSPRCSQDTPTCIQVEVRCDRMSARNRVAQPLYKRKRRGIGIEPLTILLALGLWFALGWLGPLVSFTAWSASWWFTEYRANCQATRTIGIRAVLGARDDYLANFRPSALIRIVGLSITHSPLSLTIGVCRLLHKDVH